MSWKSYHNSSYLGLTAANDPARKTFIPQTVDLTQLPPHPFNGEPIFVCIDVERDCSPDQNLTEIGYSEFDTRKVTNIIPDDRCHKWFKSIKSEHVRITEHLHSKEHRHYAFCRPRIKPAPHKFGFGHSKYKSYSEAIRYFKDKWRNIQRDHANPGQRRNIILVVWAKTMEQKTINELGLDWLETAFQRYDFQGFAAARLYQDFYLNRPGNLPGLEGFADALGIPTKLQPFGALTHNGGNDAAYEMQCFLAGISLNHIQVHTLRSRGCIRPYLPAHFHPQHVRHNDSVSSEKSRQ